MKDSIYGLSLGTLVRQMMCGIVFFIPIVLWKNSNWDSIVAWLRNWNAAGLIAFGAVVACIGTLIYHVEKNLWAYAWQYIRVIIRKRKPKQEESTSQKSGDSQESVPPTDLQNNQTENNKKSGKGSRSCPLVCTILLVFYLIICIVSMAVPVFFVVKNYWNPETWKCITFIALLIIFGILFELFPLLMFFGKPKVLVKLTQEMWKAASILPENLDADMREHSEANNSASTITPLQLLKLYELKEIARREAGWADYIHCGQTSAFAWILGCIPVMTNSAASPAPGWLIPSIWGAIWLLGFEMLCEIHKQMHINRLLSEYKALKQKMR